MANQNDDNPRYDVKTESYTDYHPGNFFLGEKRYSTKIRDNATGETYKATGSSPESSRDNAFKKAGR